MYFDPDGLRMGDSSLRQWMRENRLSFNDFLFNNYPKYDHEDIRADFDMDPELGRIVVEDYLINRESLKTNYEMTMNYMALEAHEVGLLSGSRRSGKTATAIRIIQEMADLGKIEPCWIGPPNSELERHGWTWCTNIGDMKPGSYAMYDETAVFIRARQSQATSNLDVLQYIPTLSHIGSGVLFLTQSTKQSDIALIDWCNYHLIKDYTETYGSQVEREMVGGKLLNYMKPRENYVVKSNVKSWTFVRTGTFNCLFNSEMVPWYSDKVGKAFGHIDNDEDALRLAKEMFEQDFDPGFVKSNMKIRWKDLDISFWKKFKKKVYLEDGDMENGVGKHKELDRLIIKILEGPVGEEASEYYEGEMK